MPLHEFMNQCFQGKLSGKSFSVSAVSGNKENDLNYFKIYFSLPRVVKKKITNLYQISLQPSLHHKFFENCLGDDDSSEKN